MKRSAPISTEERLLLQMNLSIVNMTASLAFIMLYFVGVLICCAFTRMLIRYLESKWRPEARRSRMEVYNNDKIKRRKGLLSTDKDQADLTRPSLHRSDNQTSIEKKQNSPNSSRERIFKTEEKQPIRNSSKTSMKKTEIIKPLAKETYLDFPRLNDQHKIDQVGLARPSLHRRDNQTSIEKKQISPNSSRERIFKPEEKQPIRNSSKTSMKKTEIIKPFAKETYLDFPGLKDQHKIENKTYQTAYADAGTYVCFDSEDSSDESTFVFLDY
ncbi:hypothetical protein HNY73_004024 [Argiope bruennichi]|uniref:Uncharacterized protein n=1 Tax=Argiope bruennichi TaxID=94029 RepID=A0A8T0FMZ3_ARGBR|nr:hypothetical protein HNY73_004024 [Argiope bruennichi]